MANKTQYIRAIESSNGTRVDVSERLGVSRAAVTLYMGKNPDIAKLLDKVRLRNIDLAESETFKQLKFRDGKNPVGAAGIRQKASFKILGTLGKDKGWVEKQELEHSVPQGININLIEKDVKEIRDGKKV